MVDASDNTFRQRAAHGMCGWRLHYTRKPIRPETEEIKSEYQTQIKPVLKIKRKQSDAQIQKCSDSERDAIFMWMNNILYRVRPDVDDDLWPAYRDFFWEVAGARFVAVPAWCKMEKRCERRTAAQVRRRYDLREFEQTRERYDPEHVFGTNLWA